MNSIDRPFTFGTAVTFDNLTILPLLGTSSPEVHYDTLDAALGRGTLQITEISESGSVPEIKVLNTGPQPVLIIDGEELVGAKQNRTVNLSILIPPAANTIVPVTCVEGWPLERQNTQFFLGPTHSLCRGSRRQEFSGQRVTDEGRRRAGRPVAGVGGDCAPLRAPAGSL
jgi:hypothetical protein